MPDGWKAHADVLVRYLDRLRRQRRWRWFCDWLDTHSGAEDFLPDLCESLQRACARFDPTRGPDFALYAEQNHFRSVLTKYVRKYRRWQREQAAGLVSMDSAPDDSPALRDRLGEQYEFIELPSGALDQVRVTGDPRLEQVPGQPEPVDPRWREPRRQALLYRIAWRREARGRMLLSRLDGASGSPGVLDLPAEAHAALTRRQWWRLLLR